MTLEDAMREACAAIGIKPPAYAPQPGVWRRVDTVETNGRGDASILIFDDRQGGIVWNWQTQQKHPFSIRRKSDAPAARRSAPDLERVKREQAEQKLVADICAQIVRTARQDVHPYLERKGFGSEIGLVHDLPQKWFPNCKLGQAMLRAMPEGDGPWLIIPGRVGKDITTVQFIAPDGSKKNILRGKMSGASHRIATGGQTWVCEGIATALTVRAALRLLGRSVTVLSAFSASNAAQVAASIPGSILAADHDKPVEAFGGQGTGEFYARRTGHIWVMPPELGDWNDYHARHGLRAVAMQMRGV